MSVTLTYASSRGTATGVVALLDCVHGADSAVSGPGSAADNLAVSEIVIGFRLE
jgi:hypothetical protein